MLRGSHSAVVIHGAPGPKIYSNNSFNAVADDRSHQADAADVWIDHPDPQHPDRRTIFFHAWRLPKDGDPSHNKNHTTLFMSGKRVLLQVRVLGYHNRPVYVCLHGKTLVLHSIGDPKGKVGSYDFGTSQTHKVQQGSTGPSPEQLVDYVAARGPLDHLVINCHGEPQEQVFGGPTVLIRLGQGFDTNVAGSLWSQLAGKVRYIWFQSCFVGRDADQCNKIAAQTGAWVTVPRFQLVDKGASALKKHIDYQDRAEYGHFHPQVKHPFSLATRNRFFREARHSPGADLAKSFYFNVTTQKEKPGKNKSEEQQ